MTCGFLIQLVVCKKKKLCGFGVEVEQADECTPSLNKILDPPLQNTVETKGLLKRFYLNDHKLRKIFVCGTRNPELWSPEYSRAQGIRNSTNELQSEIKYLDSGIQDCLGFILHGVTEKRDLRSVKVNSSVRVFRNCKNYFIRDKVCSLRSDQRHFPLILAHGSQCNFTTAGRVLFKMNHSTCTRAIMA